MVDSEANRPRDKEAVVVSCFHFSSIGLLHGNRATLEWPMELFLSRATFVRNSVTAEKEDLCQM